MLFIKSVPAQAHQPLREDFEYLASATPRILCMKPDMKTGFGSGSGSVIYHEPGDSAYILTANHVIDDCEEKGGKLYARSTSVTQSPFGQPSRVGKTYFAVTIVAQDENTDLAILKTVTRFSQQLTFLKLSKELPYPGQPIYIAGFPAPMADDFQINFGIVSMLKQTNQTKNYYARAFVIDAYTFFGNSGGPVVNDDMEIIGVAVLIFGGYVEPKLLGIGKPYPPGPSRGWAVSSQEVWYFMKKDSKLKPLYDKITAYESRFTNQTLPELAPSAAPAQDATGNSAAPR